jgi:hypothetical protein
MTFERALELFGVTELGRHEVGAHQQQHDVGRFKLGVDLLLPRFPGLDLLI